MKIYDIEGFPNPVRVRIALAEKGATDKVEFVPVDVMGGEHRTEAFKAMNPDAVVPCLELADGTHIAQCNAITEYIDGHFEGPSLTGSTPKERAQISMVETATMTPTVPKAMTPCLAVWAMIRCTAKMAKMPFLAGRMMTA